MTCTGAIGDINRAAPHWLNLVYQSPKGGATTKDGEGQLSGSRHAEGLQQAQNSGLEGAREGWKGQPAGRRAEGLQQAQKSERERAREGWAGQRAGRRDQEGLQQAQKSGLEGTEVGWKGQRAGRSEEGL